MKAEHEDVLRSASVISSEGGVIVKPRIELPSGPPAPEVPQPASAKPAYGIEQAVALLESLPQGGRNRDLVFQVVKTTLQSLKVEVSEIVADASRKEATINTKIKGLENEIAEFDARIKAKRREVQGLRKEHQQILNVRQHLEQSDRRSGSLPKQTKQKPAAKTPAVAGASPAKPSGGVISNVFRGLGVMIAGLFALFGKLGKPKLEPIDAIPDPTLRPAAPAAAPSQPPAESAAPAPKPQALAA
jgi:hypothetical protein